MQQKHKREVLEKYFDDLKSLFLKRFEYFNAAQNVTENDERRLIELLRELFFIKAKIEEQDNC